MLLLLEELLGTDLSQPKLVNLKEKPAQYHSQSWPETWLVSPLLLAHNLHTLIPDPSNARVVSLPQDLHSLCSSKQCAPKTNSELCTPIQLCSTNIYTY